MMMMLKAVATLFRLPQTGGCERANQNHIERKGSVVPPYKERAYWWAGVVEGGVGCQNGEVAIA